MNEPITINGRDIETMDRDELLAAIRAFAPLLAQLQRETEELLANLQIAESLASGRQVAIA